MFTCFNVDDGSIVYGLKFKNGASSLGASGAAYNSITSYPLQYAIENTQE